MHSRFRDRPIYWPCVEVGVNQPLKCYAHSWVLFQSDIPPFGFKLVTLSWRHPTSYVIRRLISELENGRMWPGLFWLLKNGEEDYSWNLKRGKDFFFVIQKGNDTFLGLKNLKNPVIFFPNETINQITYGIMSKIRLILQFHWLIHGLLNY